MRNDKVLHYDAFASIPNKGNPAGVVLGADYLSEEEMQRIAHKVGFNETVFVLCSDVADLRLRYFTPGHEINLCGHATMGALYCLKTKGLLSGTETVQIETNVGVLPIEFMYTGESLVIRMKQSPPQFRSFNGDVGKLAESMGLVRDDVDESKPILYGSTGTWTLLVFIKELSRFKDMKPHNQLFPDILVENPRASIHPICVETYDSNALMHARHFSSPFSGTIEDAVTGTASGVMGAYYLIYMNKDAASCEFIVEQGQEMGRDGRIQVNATRNEGSMDIDITGTAVFVQELDVTY